MSAKSSKGLKICITKGGSAATPAVPSAVSQAKPAAVTLADVTTIVTGDIIVAKNTGFPELDGKSWVAGTVDSSGKTVELLGSDTTNSTGVLATSPTMEHYPVSTMECLCLSSLTMNADEPGTTDVGTYCDPSASLPSAAVSAGSLSFAGFVNVKDSDYIELLAAADDGIQRFIRIMLPDNGYLIAPVTFSSIVWDLPLAGAIGYSGTAVLGSKLRHVF